MLIPGLLPMVMGLQPDPMITDAQLQAWAKTFAPIVIHDSREIAPLTSIDNQLALEPELQGTCADGQRLRLKVKRADFMQQPEVQKIVKDCKKELAFHFSRKVPAPEPISYYSVVTDGLYVKIQYWLYCAWNDAGSLGIGLVQQCGEHEGDWEHIAIRLDRSQLMTANTPAQLRAAIDDVYLAQHHRNQYPERKFFRGSDARLRFQGAQLEVYPAVGSHATYHEPGTYPLLTIVGMQVNDVNDGKGQKMNLAQGRLEPILSQPWFSFPGRWGAVVHDTCDAIEAVSSASNDGSFGPGHAHKVQDLYEGDWHDMLRPLASR